MKHKTFGLTLAVVATLVMASAAQATPSTVFSGNWMGQDPGQDAGGDGSWNYLEVKGGNHARVDFQDEFGTVCVDAGATNLWFSSTLSAKVNGDTMTGVFKTAKCGHTSVGWLRGETHTWTLDDNGTPNPADDTMWDGYVSWFRV